MFISVEKGDETVKGSYSPVIRSNEEHVTLLLAALVNNTNSLVSGSNTDDGSLVNTGVANHIWRSKVVHNEFEFAFLYTLAHLQGNTSCAHLRSLVVGSDALVGWDQILLLISDFQWEDLLNTSIEEESNVSVFFSFRNVDLGNALGTKSFRKNVAHVLGLERDLEWIVELILGHGGKGDILGVGEILQWRAVSITKELCDFTDTIRAVVEEEDFVTICLMLGVAESQFRPELTLDTSFLATKNDGLQELIILTPCVSLLDCLHWVGAFLPVTDAKCVQADLNSLPSLITVHGIVSTNNRGDFTNANLLDLVEKTLHVPSSGFGVSVTSVTEEVDIDVGDFHLFGDLEESIEVILLGVLCIH